MSLRGPGPLLLALLCGCGTGSVKVDDGDAFGKVRSGLWLDMESSTAASHSFVLLDAKGACADAQDMFPATAAAEAELVLKLEPLLDDPASQCTVYEAHYKELADLTDPLFGEGLHVLNLTLRDPVDAAEDAPPDGVYERFDVEKTGDNPYFLGRVTYYDSNPYRIFADYFDCSGAFQEDLDAATEAAVHSWSFADGEAEAELAKSGESYKISVSGGLEDIDGKSGGSASAKGTFDRCPITYEGDTFVTL